MRIHPISCGFGVSFLLEYPYGMLLIDAGSPGQHAKVLEKMKALDRTDLKLIWITHAHYDHYGSAAALRKLTGARIGVHPADADSLGAGLSPLGTARGRGRIFPLVLPLLNRIQPLPAAPVDFTLEDGGTLETYGFPATVLHTPGHTPGHTCLLFDGGVAFAADLIGAFPYPQVQSVVATDWSQIPGSLAHLQACQPQWVYTGHSLQPMSGEILQQIRARS